MEEKIKQPNVYWDHSGQPYLPFQERINWWRRVHPKGSISVRVVSSRNVVADTGHDGNSPQEKILIIHEACIKDEKGRNLSAGTGLSCVNSKDDFKQEELEGSYQALSMALKLAGYDLHGLDPAWLEQEKKKYEQARMEKINEEMGGLELDDEEDLDHEPKLKVLYEDLIKAGIAFPKDSTFEDFNSQLGLNSNERNRNINEWHFKLGERKRENKDG